jgi:hypothetical protein
MNRLRVSVLIGIVIIIIAMTSSGGSRVRAQEGCPPGQVCNPDTCEEGGIDSPLQEESNCTTEEAFFTEDDNSWTYVFDPNNAIKITTDVACPFPLQVDKIEITQADYEDRTAFPNTACNPSGAGGNCVFYRVHGDTAPSECYGEVNYKLFWNTPKIQGNKHDYMLLRAPCEEFTGDPNGCSASDVFTEDITNFLAKKLKVGDDPVMGGDADGMSDYIVAIDLRHPHKGINK